MDKESLEVKEKPTSRNPGAILQQIGLNMLMLGILALLGLLVWQRFFGGKNSPAYSLRENIPVEGESAESSAANQQDEETFTVELNPLLTPQPLSNGIFRQTKLDTIIPSRPRVDVITYTVKTGDTLFSIADIYNLKPETILWGNFEVLEDNPHLLKPDQELNILPVNGLYYQWQENDRLSNVAAEFQADPNDILNFTGNFFDLTEIEGDGESIEPGTWIIIPEGKRAIKDWGPPTISRDNPASAAYYGEGHCGVITSGAVGVGTFLWPTTERFISGYHFSSVHPAIDIGGQEGNPIYAVDSGVVVYAGWSDYGYGYLIVLDHGNGWQSAYSHLSAVAVSCGQSVYQGGYIGALGTTGNSSGPHLHFELSINGAKVNPMNYLQ
jgi:murein DD-endopeptidase MepM/ murein hydrolase activator NlpD